VPALQDRLDQLRGKGMRSGLGRRRYLEYLSSLDDFSAGIRALHRLTQPLATNRGTDAAREMLAAIVLSPK
jgi:hypothetical protein